jgi:hypothetical protein
MSDDADLEKQLQFAQDKVGKFLLHVPTGTVGKVGKVYAPGEYGHPKPRPADAVGDLVSFDDDLRPRVTEAVLEFEDGNSFLVRPENFRVLSEGDQLTFAAATAGLKSFVAEIVEGRLEGCSDVWVDPRVAEGGPPGGAPEPAPRPWSPLARPASSRKALHRQGRPRGPRSYPRAPGAT